MLSQMLLVKILYDRENLSPFEKHRAGALVIVF